MKHKYSLSRIKMGKRVSKFWYIEIEKKLNFTAKRLLFFFVCVWKKIYKYFIGYLYNDHKVKPLHITLPKTSVYVKTYDMKNK